MTTSALPLFYQRPQALQPGLHGKLSVLKQPNYAFAANANSVPLVSGELAAACRHFPIVFTDGEQPAPVAVLGLRGQENLFVSPEGEWLGNTYIPAYIRRYPFIFLENGDQLTLCVDAAAGNVVESAEHPLFTDDGKPSELTRHALEFCREYQSQHVHTLEFSRALAQADILVENKADITLPNGQRLTLSGFKVIDEAKFNAMPEQVFLNWRAKGWLTLVYCHLISVGTWNNLLGQIKPD